MRSREIREVSRAGTCTAFKVGDRLVATAAHCIRTADQCARSSFAFEFERSAAQEGGQILPPIPATRIYHCTRVVASEEPPFKAPGADWAIVEVDREIAGVPTLQLARADKAAIQLQAKVTVIGHPMGLPKIVTPGGHIQRALNDRFVIDSDTYGGNSGSPVFLGDSIDGGRPMVVGILAHGAKDFEDEMKLEAGSMCRSSRRCGKIGDSGCGGEGVTYSGRFIDKVEAFNAAAAGSAQPR